MLDTKALAEATAAIVREHVAAATAPLTARIDALEAAQGTVKAVDLADLLIDRDGCLVAAFSDGRMKTMGRVVGKDGDPGRDGMGPEDIGVSLMDDARTVRFAFTKGDTEYAFQIPFPVVLDRGVYVEGKDYEAGDAVTWGGSLWIAQRDTSSKPDGADSGWRLAVKRGRDAKDRA